MIIGISGPTGVGKTKMSTKLAKHYNGIIINGDAMQVYKKMDIATAKIKEEEKEGIPHYLFDIKDFKEDYSIYDYQKDVRKLIDENKDKNIIIVGGSGLYHKAALYDYKLDDEEESIKDDYEEYTNEELYDIAIKKDPDLKVHVNNRKRLIRVLNKENVEHQDSKLLYDDVIFIGLTTNREKLYSIIDNRVDEMVKEGLLEEAKYFYDNKVECKSLNTVIGYKELFKYFDGELSLEEAIDLIKKNSRHYAKRQYTWFNHQIPIKWFDVDFSNFDNTIKEVYDYIKKER